LLTKSALFTITLYVFRKLQRLANIAIQGIIIGVTYTPNFHPAMGITPITHTVVQQIDNVANNPIMMFIVVKVMIGNANVLTRINESIS
jgi:patatin-like phospholipase/acyl hydrolase